ncbi:MAG: TIGR04086 family membrane protein [Clostridiales bacterium]|nr:TIGR04086 family membrane protein [Clostridiales bacterium]
MSKNGVRGYIVVAILLALFSVIAFAAPFSMTSTFWIAYVSGVIAILLQIYVFSISFSKGKGAKSKFYGFPIARIGVVYLIVQFALSIIEMIFADDIPAWVAIIINVIVFAIAAIGCIAADLVRDEVVRQDVQVKANISNIRSLQALSAGLPGMCSDEALKKDLQKLADEFKYSDPVSSDATKALEADMAVQLNDLKNALGNGDYDAARSYCGKLLSGLSERNRVCKLNK